MSRRNAIMAPTVAKHPYSSSMTQPGSAPHGRPSVRKCHITYVGITLTDQRMISSVEADVRNGSSQRRYHGNTTGANKRHAAIGHANWSGDHSGAADTPPPREIYRHVGRRLAHALSSPGDASAVERRSYLTEAHSAQHPAADGADPLDGSLSADMAGRQRSCVRRAGMRYLRTDTSVSAHIPPNLVVEP
jgi:hypothetical protein